MLKRFLVAVVALGVCSTSIFAQDVYVNFGQGAEASATATAAVADGTGTAFVYVRRGFEFDGFSVDLVAGDGSVAQITSATVVNSNVDFGGTRFNNAAVDTNSNGELDGAETGDINAIPGTVAGNTATYQATSINQNGIIASNFATFDNGFDVAADAFLLAQVDYTITGPGVVDFALQTTSNPAFAGPTGFLTIPEGQSLSPVFGNGTLTVTGVAVPEPSTLGLLALGLVGVVARRRR